MHSVGGRTGVAMDIATELSMPASTGSPRLSTHAALRRVLWCLMPATTAAFGMFNGVAQILIPAQVQHIDPATKVANLALLATTSTITAFVGLMVGGALSDRTYSRWGRRTPWLVLSAVASAILLVTLGTRTSLPGVAASYLLLWFAANIYLGALTPIIVDRVPENRRGIASTVVGLGVPFGILIGVNFVARVPQETGYVLLAVFLLATMALLVTWAREGSAVGLRPARTPSRDTAPGTPWARFTASLESFRSADFTYAFLGRALILLSFNMLVSFLSVLPAPGLYRRQKSSAAESRGRDRHSDTVSNGGLGDRHRRSRIARGSPRPQQAVRRHLLGRLGGRHVGPDREPNLAGHDPLPDPVRRFSSARTTPSTWLSSPWCSPERNLPEGIWAS